MTRHLVNQCARQVPPIPHGSLCVVARSNVTIRQRDARLTHYQHACLRGGSLRSSPWATRPNLNVSSDGCLAKLGSRTSLACVGDCRCWQPTEPRLPDILYSVRTASLPPYFSSFGGVRVTAYEVRAATVAVCSIEKWWGECRLIVGTSLARIVLNWPSDRRNGDTNFESPALRILETLAETPSKPINTSQG